MKGFFKKVLRIHLGDRSYRTEEIPEEVYANYLGGKGLGTYLLLRDNPPGIDPLSPQNLLIFTLGPITDTAIWGSSRYDPRGTGPFTPVAGGLGQGGPLPRGRRPLGP